MMILCFNTLKVLNAFKEHAMDVSIEPMIWYKDMCLYDTFYDFYGFMICLQIVLKEYVVK